MDILFGILHTLLVNHYLSQYILQSTLDQNATFSLYCRHFHSICVFVFFRNGGLELNLIGFVIKWFRFLLFVNMCLWFNDMTLTNKVKQINLQKNKKNKNYLNICHQVMFCQSRTCVLLVIWPESVKKLILVNVISFDHDLNFGFFSYPQLCLLVRWLYCWCFLCPCSSCPSICQVEHLLPVLWAVAAIVWQWSVAPLAWGTFPNTFLHPHK